MSGRDASQAVGERAVVNTVYRSAAEALGRLASLALFVVAGRVVGQAGLGAYVSAFAFVGLVMVGVSLGYDRYMLREVAQERGARDHLFFNVLLAKVALALPLFALTLPLLHFLGYSTEAQLTALALVPGTMSDSLARTQLALFSADERAGPPAMADALQRICSAGLGILALVLGFGVVGVGVTYSLGSMVGLAITFLLLPRTIGMPARRVSPRSWRGLIARSTPFGVQDLLTLVLARLDVLLLTLLVTEVAVGRYGAAYRLFESTFLVTLALVGAFSAMFTYLDRSSDPPLRVMFQRSVKLGLVVLTPLAVVYVVLAEPICRLVYGDDFAAAADPLRILAPGVVLLSVAGLASSLVLARDEPRRLIPLTAAVVALNVGLNLVLIPPYAETGAAAAMTMTLLVQGVLILRLAGKLTGRLWWLPTAGSAAIGGGGMAAVALLLADTPWLALVVGGLAYLALLALVERLVSPVDFRFGREMIRRLLTRWGVRPGG